MKRLILLAFVGMLCLGTLFGCSGSQGDNPSNSPSGQSVPSETSTPTKAAAPDTQPKDDFDDDVVDLTQLSSTMVYAEVNNIMIAPREYIGKTIRMSGAYNGGYYEPTERYYHSVIIQDATACCAQGLEFNLPDDFQDFPENGTVIEVEGVFESYQELGQTYYRVVAEDFTEK